MIRVFSKAAVQAKNMALKGTLCLQILFQSKKGDLIRYKNVIKRSNIKHSSLGRDPM
jgi:hypothetical protein